MKKFEQMKKLYTTLRGYIDSYNASDAVVSGTTADFDRLFELSRKTLKEYLYSNLGINEAKSGSPKMILSLAYRERLLDDERIWLEMLRYRNDDTYHYNKPDAMFYISRIEGKYLSEIERLIKTLKVVIPESLLTYCRERKLNLANYVLDLEKQYGYKDAISVFANWEKIRSCQYMDRK